MKLTSNVERSAGHSIRAYWELLEKKKVSIFTSFLFLIGSFYLAQAVLFDAAVPFFLPVWALAHARFKQHIVWVFIGGMAGSVFLGFGQAVIHLLELLLFTGVIRYAFTRKSIPLTVTGVVIVVQVIWQFIMYGGQPPVIVQLSIGFEAVLALFMTFFLFLAFQPIDRLYFGRWTAERLSAVCIIGAMMATGMNGMMIGPVSVTGVLIHVTILLAALAGGIPFSATVAMIIAAIIGMAELSFTGMMAVYGMTGFLAGAVRRFGKMGIVSASLFVSVFFLLYDYTLPLDSSYFITIGVASFLFLLIPAKKVEPVRNALLPENQESSEKRQKWLTERLDGQLADFQQFAEFMSTLVTDRFSTQDEASVQDAPSICQSCFRYSKCWSSQKEGMAPLFQAWEASYSATKKSARRKVEEQMKYKCIRFTGLLAEIEEQSASRILKGQLQHGRKMLALQLRDMSQHLEKMMNEIKEDISVYKPDEEELAKRLVEKNIEFFQIDVLSGERGGRRIVVCIPERKSSFETDTTIAERLVLPVLEEMYEEPFQVMKSVRHSDPFGHLQLTFHSAIRFAMDYGIVATSGNETFQAGDAYEVFPIHDGLTAILLSDGMGSDLNAYRESRKVIRLMRECLNRKMNPETAMHTLHYMMALNGLDDMYATLDLAIVDLQEGRLWSWKAGSMSTYIKRGTDFIRLDSKSVPVGFLPSFSIEAKNEELKAGDLIVMMTDGLFNGDISLEIQEKALYSTLEKYGHADCDYMADRIMFEMERRFRTAGDDRTVLVMRIDHSLPKWTAFKPHAPIISLEKMIG